MDVVNVVNVTVSAVVVDNDFDNRAEDNVAVAVAAAVVVVVFADDDNLLLVVLDHADLQYAVAAEGGFGVAVEAQLADKLYTRGMEPD